MLKFAMSCLQSWERAMGRCIFSSYMLLLLTFGILTAKCYGSSSTNSHGAIGQGFFVPRLNLLTDELHASGANIFASLPDECILTSNVGRTQRYDNYFSNTQSVYQAVSTNSKISASLQGPYTLSASVSAVTNNIVAGNSEVSGTSINIKAYTKDHVLKRSCINTQKLNQQFLKDFKGLDRKIKQPWLSRSWSKYMVFLKKYGSHVVSKVMSGSSINQYAFAKSSEHYTQRDFTVKACVSLGGMTNAGKLGVSACSGVTKEEAKQSSAFSMVKKLVIRGGQSSTRAQLIHGPTEEVITKILVEGKEHPSPITYKFVSIWELLQLRYIGTPEMAKVLNLEQYFKGYLNFDCSYKKTSNGKELQKFVLSENSDPDAPTYSCMLGPTGCHDHDDCHYKAAFWCACGGPSCIRYKDVKLNAGTTRKEAYAYTSTSPGWGWQGCNLKGLTCWCTKPNKSWQEAWTGEINDSVRDLHSMMVEERNYVRALKQRCVKE